MSEPIERPVPWGKFKADNADAYPAPSTPDWQHRNRESNGLTKCGALVKIQGRWYVFPSKYWKWLAAGERSAA